MSLQKLDEEAKKLRGLQKQVQENAKQHEALLAQQSENELVRGELDVVEAGGEVFKLVGPVLVRQSLDDARDTVRKRLEFIAREIAARETKSKELEIAIRAQTVIVIRESETFPPSFSSPFSRNFPPSFSTDLRNAKVDGSCCQEVKGRRKNTCFPFSWSRRKRGESGGGNDQVHFFGIALAKPEIDEKYV